MLGKEAGEVFVPGLGKDGQIAAIDHLQVGGTCMAYDVAESWMHLRSAAGQVQGADRMGIDHREQRLDDLVGHRLGAGGAGVDMAMQTPLVAQVRQVYLQHLQRTTPDGGEIEFVE